ncbi:scoloptoxin SSD14-like [Chelonus insularis]|uniref:scoloptoxin SSD14-like n=1 Tax=Chelonus insularis TaxID=460826 RepID=UPI00158AD2B4|nr:scoloptoxin SSD14-like [Chelonus insularis]
MFGRYKKAVIGVGIVLFLSIIIAVILLKTGILDDDDDDNLLTKSWGKKLISKSYLGKFQKAAVSSNGEECSDIGNGILKKNGSAVDAAISMLLCEGVSSLHSSGLGGGFLMTIWDAKNKTAVFLDARETAPKNATKDMFNGNAAASRFGGMAIAVPGELAGYWEAHQRYGKLPWKELFLPVIELCERGALVNPYLERSLKSKLQDILAEPTLADILIDPNTNSTWTSGKRIKRPQLKKTLEMIADSGKDIFYDGIIGEALVREIQQMGGIIEMDDLRSYRALWKNPISSKIGKHIVHTAALPGSGVILAFALNVLESFVPTANESVFYQRFAETFKWAFAKRTELGDDNFVNLTSLMKNLTSKTYADEVRQKILDNWTSTDPKYYGAITHTPDDFGTAHISILASDGSAVSATSTINQVLGAMKRSPSTGIIFNDEMDDFSSPNIINSFELPPSPANFIAPGKRPLSSMVPTIITDDKGEVQLVVGAAGGTKITTGVALTIVLNLWTGYTIKEAIDVRRLHHQLLPMRIEAEPNFPSAILNYLKSINHTIEHYVGIGSAVTAISKLNHPGITANADYRRYGSVAGC